MDEATRRRRREIAMQFLTHIELEQVDLQIKSSPDPNLEPTVEVPKLPDHSPLDSLHAEIIEERIEMMNSPDSIQALPPPPPTTTTAVDETLRIIPLLDPRRQQAVEFLTSLSTEEAHSPSGEVQNGFSSLKQNAPETTLETSQSISTQPSATDFNLAPATSSTPNVSDYIRQSSHSPQMFGPPPTISSPQSSAALHALSSSASLSATGTPPNNQRSKQVDSDQQQEPVVIHAKVNLKRDAGFDILNQDARIYLTSTQLGSPVVLFSVLRLYDSKKRSRKKVYMDKFASIDPLKKRKLAESFAHFLQPVVTTSGLYNPFELDDPELKTGRHRTVITLPSYISSIIEYARPSQLKHELNQLFRQRHPDIVESGLSLSKIRNLKMALLEVALAENLELASVANAYTYFERLVLRHYVNKENRKLIGAICLFLAVKINDIKDLDYAALLAQLEKVLWVSPKEIRDSEFAVFVELEFNLRIPLEEFMPHMERLVRFLDYYNVQEYLSGKPPPDIQLPYIR